MSSGRPTGPANPTGCPVPKQTGHAENAFFYKNYNAVCLRLLTTVNAAQKHSKSTELNFWILAQFSSENMHLPELWRM